MRNAIVVPDKWKELGVWYFPNVDDNQETWRRYRALMDLTRPRKPYEVAELVELEAKVEDLFAVRIQPYSFAEYQRQSKKIALKSIGKKGVADDVDAVTVGDAIATEICKERCLEVRNYQAGRRYVDEEGNQLFNDDGSPRIETWMITTGAELVEYITKEAGEEEAPVIEDIFKAIRNRSHLDLGQKKTWAPSPNSSPSAT